MVSGVSTPAIGTAAATLVDSAVGIADGVSMLRAATAVGRILGLPLLGGGNVSDVRPGMEIVVVEVLDTLAVYAMIALQAVEGIVYTVHLCPGELDVRRGKAGKCGHGKERSPHSWRNVRGLTKLRQSIDALSLLFLEV
jgi:hypothetical protein